MAGIELRFKKAWAAKRQILYPVVSIKIHNREYNKPEVDVLNLLSCLIIASLSNFTEKYGKARRLLSITFLVNYCFPFSSR